MDEKYDLRHFYDFCTQTFEHSVWRDFLKHWPHQKEMEPYSDGKNRSLEDPGRFGSYLIGYKSNQDLAKISQLSERLSSISLATNQPVIKEKLTEYFPLIQTRTGPVCLSWTSMYRCHGDTQERSMFGPSRKSIHDPLRNSYSRARIGIQQQLYRCNDGTFSDCGNLFLTLKTFGKFFATQH